MAMTKIFAPLIMLVLLTGCTKIPAQKAPTEAYNAAQAAYRLEVFERCMAALPAGPISAQYNDWAEVVDECADVAYYQMKTRYPP